MNKKLAVVAVSGGLDSCVTAAIANQKYRLALAHINYGQKTELRYFRDERGREVDFIVTKKGIPWLAVEVKESEQELDTNLKYLLERIKIPFSFQVHLDGDKFKRVPDINNSKIHILPAHIFLANML